MILSPFSSSFLDTYCLSISSLGCKAFCIVLNLKVSIPFFWVPFFIWRMVPSIIQKVLTRYLPPWCDGYPKNFFENLFPSSEVFFLFSSSSSFVWLYLLPEFLNICNFLPVRKFGFFLDFAVLFFMIFLFFHFFLTVYYKNMAHTKLDSYIVRFYKSFIFFSFFENSLIMFRYIRGLVFPCNFVNI